MEKARKHVNTINLIEKCNIPYRLDLAGGWLDQKIVSRCVAGPVITISIEPTLEFNQRSGMASSTRKRAIELWSRNIPSNEGLAKLARMLFSCDNPPGTRRYSGSQDAIGIVYPGLNRLDYCGEDWPQKIESVQDENILEWLERHLCLLPIGPRKNNFNVFKGKQITVAHARRLAKAANQCWRAIIRKDVFQFGRSIHESFEAQVALFPAMMTTDVRAAIELNSKRAVGWKLAGAGGGGYLVLVTEQDISHTIKIKIRRKAVGKTLSTGGEDVGEC